jgi:hypothetical protein
MLENNKIKKNNICIKRKIVSILFVICLVVDALFHNKLIIYLKEKKRKVSHSHILCWCSGRSLVSYKLYSELNRHFGPDWFFLFSSEKSNTKCY